jgi:hypothetical protein
MTKGINMENRIDKNKICFASQKEHDKKERDYWSKASYEEKAMTITYLRECFYGPEATTGRLQGFYKFFKYK